MSNSLRNSVRNILKQNRSLVNIAPEAAGHLDVLKRLAGLRPLTKSNHGEYEAARDALREIRNANAEKIEQIKQQSDSDSERENSLGIAFEAAVATHAPGKYSAEVAEKMLAYFRVLNWGLWPSTEQWPDFGCPYICNQYEVNGKTAVVIKFDDGQRIGSVALRDLGFDVDFAHNRAEG